MLRVIPAPDACERDDLTIARILKPNGEVLERITEPADLLPELDIPQPTELAHFGRTFPAAARHTQARARASALLRHASSRVLVAAIGLVVLALLGALHL